MITERIKTLFLVVGILSIGLPAFAQTPGTVTIVKDPRIDTLIARRLELEREKSGTNRVTGDGYRVQIFTGSDREKAFAEQANFKSQYPSLNTYISYSQPNYKIRVGDFRTRLEAEKFMNQIRDSYPTRFIFRERINFSR